VGRLKEALDAIKDKIQLLVKDCKENEEIIADTTKKYAKDLEKLANLRNAVHSMGYDINIKTSKYKSYFGFNRYYWDAKITFKKLKV